MATEQEGAASTESGTPVADAIFSDTTPIDETFDDSTTVEDETTDDEVDETVEDDDEDVEVDDDGEEIKPASFDNLEAANKHIAKQNRENAAKRVELKEYKEVFGKFTPEIKSGLLGLLDTLATDPEAGAHQLAQVAKNILGEDAFAPEAEIDEDKPLTVKEWKELQAKEVAKQAETKRQEVEREEGEKAVKAIFTKAEELGYKESTPERHLLLSIAAADAEHGGTNGSIEEAHAAVDKLRQQWVQEYLDGKAGQTDRFPTTTEGAAPGDRGNSPKTWKDFIAQGTEMANAANNVGK